MDILDCTRNSDVYHKHTIHAYAAEHAHHYCSKDYHLKARLLDIRSKQNSYFGYPSTNVFYLDRLNAKRLTEQRYCLDLKTLCATRTVPWQGYELKLVCAFDGLEKGAENGMVWIHIPYSQRNHGLITHLGWSGYLDEQTKFYIEHLLMVAKSKEAMITCSDGTFGRTISHEYTSDVEVAFDLLHHYAAFEHDLRALQDAKHNQYRLE